jgi:hypothetical protein
MVNKIKSIKRKKINPPKKKETSSQRVNTKKFSGTTKKSDEVEALALTWNEDLCE